MWNPRMAAGEPPEGQRTFSSNLKQGTGRRFVLFACILFSVIGLASYAATGLVPIMPVIFTAGTLFHFWPALNQTRPAFQLDSAGITIDGLGTLVWEAVSGARIRHISRVPVQMQLLEIDTVLPALSMMAEDSRPRGVRKFQTKIGRLTGPRQIIVDLTNLEDPSKDILHALEYFLQRRVRGAVV
jgi:hypothetical protein